MKQLSASEAVLTELIKESETLQLSDDGTKVKRKAPMPEKDTINERSVYLVRFLIYLFNLSHALFCSLSPLPFLTTSSAWSPS